MGNMEVDFYQHYKYYHFYSICFGLGCGTALYRPFCSLMIPSVLGVFFTIVFAVVGFISDLPAHTRRCKGPPYVRRVYTLSYGCGIIVFAIRGAIRKYSSLKILRKRKRRRW
ncbi:hypothetical protein PFLUV_G00044730 [Perca fluviatilis]|uniref:Uncharacterized protein n=1 Tax=Perca fluviatilis TaxID=8168 RepID=A0A6A5FLY9_PERFL|nr:hypothetical protein PFLUV_G00044730 [Perca fluviatilis]